MSDETDRMKRRLCKLARHRRRFLLDADLFVAMAIGYAVLTTALLWLQRRVTETSP